MNALKKGLNVSYMNFTYIHLTFLDQLLQIQLFPSGFLSVEFSGYQQIPSISCRTSGYVHIISSLFTFLLCMQFLTQSGRTLFESICTKKMLQTRTTSSYCLKYAKINRHYVIYQYNRNFMLVINSFPEILQDLICEIKNSPETHAQTSTVCSLQ